MPVSKTSENLSLNERLVAALVVRFDEGAATLLPASKRLVASWGFHKREYLMDRVSGQNLIPTLGELVAKKAVESQGTLAETASLSFA